MRIVGGHVEFDSAVQYLSVFCLWMFVNSVAGNLMVSITYCFTIRHSGIIPWRLSRFMREMVRSGILERTDGVFRFAHQRYYEYFTAKCRYSHPHL